MTPKQFTEAHLTQPKLSGIDVITTLRNFAIVTYMVEPAALRPHIAERFELDVITAPDGSEKALISVVPFYDEDFRFAKFPWYEWAFGQTNYRAYVKDRETGEHAVWFFGTVLDSWTVNIPRHLWRLPWHRAHIAFDCAYEDGRFTRYEMRGESEWAAADLSLEDSGNPPTNLFGFPDVETGLLILTHPLKGYYYRRDGSLGMYHIWHDRLAVTSGRVINAQFGLLDRLGLVPNGDISQIHSVLMQEKTEFSIYLPPKPISISVES